MAIIKCPECGHQVSDRAPVCPSCGVEIAGNINKCTRCGEVFFRDEHFCPNCHQPVEGKTPNREETNETATATKESPAEKETKQTAAPEPEQQREERRQPIAVSPVPTPTRKKEERKNEVKKEGNSAQVKIEDSKKKKRNLTALIISFILAVLACGVLIYTYSNAKERTENDEYAFAMKSNDPVVLQQYLDNFLDAPKAHRDSIMAHLEKYKKIDEAWAKVAKSTNREEILKYLEENPNSPNKTELTHRIDSLDWDAASKENTQASYQKYIDEHATGEHYDEAQLALNKQKAKELSPEDRQMVSRVFHNFFVSINSKNEGGLTSSVAEVMSNFLGRENASKGDVIDYMNRSYKDGVSAIVWRLKNDYRITKREVGDGKFEYSVRFTADQDVVHSESASEKNSYNITARVNPDGLISEMNMSKFTREEKAEEKKEQKKEQPATEKAATP
ncbi:MAG: zinc ribbon domain-containing protein [Prevotella sp.]|nr:zinc ribbon domain-containing protein [Prevotella sp.]